MPGFEADDSQETHPETYFSPAAALSSNFTSKSSNAGYGGGYQGSGSATGYSANPDTSVTSGGGSSSTSSKSSGATKAASSSMVDSVSGGGSSDTVGGGGAADSIKSPALPAVYDDLYQNQQIPKASPTQNLHYAGVLASLPNPETGRPYYSGPATPKGVKSGAFTAAVVDFQNANGFIKDGLIGIGPYAQTGPALDKAHAAMRAAPPSEVQGAPEMASPMGAVANAPASPLEAARGSFGVRPTGSYGTEGGSSPLAAVKMNASGEAGRAPFGSGYVTTEPGDIANHEEAIKAIIAPFGVGAGQMPGAGLQYARGEAPPDYGKRSSDARRGPVRINQGPELPGRAPAAPAAPAAGGFGAPADVPAGYRPPPPAEPPQAQGVGAPDVGTATPDEPAAFLPREPNMTVTRNERTGTPGRVPTNPIQPGATTVSPLEAARPAPPAGGDRFASELQKLREQYGLKPGDHVGPGEAPAAPPTAQETEFLETAKAGIASGRYEPGPAAYGIKTPGQPQVSGLEQAAQAARSGLGGGAPAEGRTPPQGPAQPFNVGAGVQPGAASSVLRIIGIMPKGEDRLPGGESQPNVKPAGPEVDTLSGTENANQGPELVGGEAHAAALKQVTDMMANQPQEKQQAVADHMVIFAHAASLVASAPPEQRAAAFDEQLTRLKSIGAIDDATEKKLRGTTPTDAMLNQMIELGKAVHDMGVGPQSSLGAAKANGAAMPPIPGAQGASPQEQVADSGYSDNPYGIEGNVDKHGLPLEAKPPAVRYPDRPANDSRYRNEEQFKSWLDKTDPGMSPEEKDMIWQNELNRSRSLEYDIQDQEGNTPTSDAGGRRQVASADGSQVTKDFYVSNPVGKQYGQHGDGRNRPLAAPYVDRGALMGDWPRRYYDEGWAPVETPNVNDRYPSSRRRHG